MAHKTRILDLEIRDGECKFFTNIPREHAELMLLIIAGELLSRYSTEAIRAEMDKIQKFVQYTNLGFVLDFPDLTWTVNSTFSYSSGGEMSALDVGLLCQWAAESSI